MIADILALDIDNHMHTSFLITKFNIYASLVSETDIKFSHLNPKMNAIQSW